MDDKVVKTNIQNAIRSFAEEDLSKSALNLFSTLGYNTDRQNVFPQKTYQYFKESFIEKNVRFDEEKAWIKEWKQVDLLFQLSQKEMSDQTGLFDNKKVKWKGEDKESVIETYLFFVIELKKENYSRTVLAQITRELNKIFPMPAMILFKHGEQITLAIINRRLHKKDERKDVLEKVTLIKNIYIANPHRAHIEILFDLSFDELYHNYAFSNFVELHNAWQKTLDIKELNKRFYHELANWYFWAMDKVRFPDDVEKDEEVRNATSLIRLITRIIFIWFIKEKNLVPETLFDLRSLESIIKDFRKNDKVSNYYNAILQNLFFGTLNQREERAFAQDGTSEENKNHYGIKTLYRYKEAFLLSEEKAKNLFKDVPFLNGGLFDCLDKENDEKKVEYIDGFSRNDKKRAVVPDFLFFSDEREVDLNEVYGTKNKKYVTRGLFNILNNYKFTITENTPIEEEIALDPELLGKVFENLLASYNPETKSTARKQTGSFYTPREIVNYMVDESLKTYLKQKLESDAGMKPEDAGLGLEYLLGYNEKEHLFDKKQTEVLINAIDNCKILDPACGSGAFPMGALHKMVHILHKLDPKNEKWKERQIKRLSTVDDTIIRERSIKETEDAFANNELDYGRKLFLIENCLYGVDIQPIAVQIAKLRFFISLIVDQRVDRKKENVGILPLPNLETKFVAANSLIGIERPAQASIFDVDTEDRVIEKLKEELKEIRHQHFSVRTRKEKNQLHEKDKKKRRGIADYLKANKWSSDDAEKIAQFDIYDQNKHADWFDPEWMFGVRDGFNIVIGNPPYIFTRDADFSEDFKKYIAEYYFAQLSPREIKSRANQSGKINLFALFILRGIFDIHENGILCYIVPNNLLRTTTYDLIRKYILENSKLEEVIDLGSGIFDNVTASTVIVRLSKSRDYRDHKSQIITNVIDLEKKIFSKSEIPQPQFVKNESHAINIFSDSNIENIISRLNMFSKQLKDDFEICAGGIATGPGKAESISNTKLNEKYKPLIEGKDVKPYVLNYRGLFIEYDRKKLYRAREEFIFLLPEKLITQRIGGGDTPLVVAYDNKQYYTFNSTNIIYCKPHSELSLKTLLAILNSKLLNWFYSTQFSNRSDLTVNISKTYLDKLPTMPISKEQQNKITKLVDRILLAKQRNAKADISAWEREIDELVYALYGLTPEEIKIVEEKKQENG